MAHLIGLRPGHHRARHDPWVKRAGPRPVYEFQVYTYVQQQFREVQYFLPVRCNLPAGTVIRIRICKLHTYPIILDREKLCHCHILVHDDPVSRAQQLLRDDRPIGMGGWRKERALVILRGRVMLSCC
jgi:hypothetical protein